MLRHTTFCKKISRGLGLDPSSLDEHYECRNLDAAIRSLGYRWRDLDGAMLIDVVESGGTRTGDSVQVYRELIQERLQAS